MLDDKYSQIESWHPQFRAFPKPTHLYPLKPLALGTNGVESFTSYIKRLAAIHQVPTGVLLAQEIAPFITRYKGKHPSRLSSLFFHVFFNQTGAWNGTGVMAIEPLEVLQRLTNQPNLKSLTLIAWSKVLPTRNLLRKHHAWCPLCYFEWDQAGIPIHEPLLWSISAITACPKHQQVLLNKCPNCGQSIYSLAWNSRTGFCCRCHHWLGLSCSINDGQSMTYDYWEWQNFVGQQVGEILAYAPYLIQPPQKEKVASAIEQCINSATGGKNTTFAALMCLSSSVPRDWRNGHALPQLNLLLRVCYRLSISLLDFFTGNVTINEPIVLKELPLCQQHSKTNRSFDPVKVEEFLMAALSSSPPKSLRQVASEVGYDPADLYRNFSGLCRQISARYKSHTKSMFNPYV